MSNMIRCDKCHTMMYDDSRSNKGDYCAISIQYTNGTTFYHLCKVCHRQFLTEFTRSWTPEEYDEEFSKWQI